MKRKLLLSAVAVLLVVSIAMVGCPAPPPAPPPRPVKVVAVFGDSFGCSTYCAMVGAETFFVDHPWLRLAVSETPGFVWDIKKMLKDPEAPAKSIFPSSPTMLRFARDGVAPFFEKPNPEAAKMKVLFSFNIGLIGMATLDKELADPKKCQGKRIALGREPQLWWCQFPKTVLEEGYGLTFKIDYMGPTPAASALLDGVADFCCTGGYGSCDLKEVKPADFLIALEASGRDFYYLNFDKEAIRKAAEKSGFGYIPVTVPANSFPKQPEDVVFLGEIQAFLVHESFPEEDAYEVVKVMIENYKKLADFHALGGLCTPGSFVTGWPEESYHKGAIKAYKEAGLTPHEL